MGNCCGQTSHDITKKDRYMNYSEKSNAMSNNKIVICLDIIPTPSSSKLKISLKGDFNNFVSFNSERKLIDYMKSSFGWKYFIVITGRIEEDTLNYLIYNKDVISIYLCLGKIRDEQILNSNKIKGLFQKEIHLKKAIFNDIYVH